MSSRLEKLRSNELPMLSTDFIQDNVPALVVNRIFVGSIHAAFNQEAIHGRGITHVLNASGLPATFPRRFTYLGVDIHDKEEANILSAIAATNMFIEAGVEKGGVLVHCLGGHSRSPSFVIAYLMSSNGYSFDQAYEVLRLARPVASINRGFEHQLRAYSATGCDAYAAHQLVLRLRLASIKPSPLTLRNGKGRSSTEEYNRVGGEGGEGGNRNNVLGDDKGLVSHGSLPSLLNVSIPAFTLGGGRGGGNTIKQQQGKVNNDAGPIGKYLPLKSTSCRLRFSSPSGPSMRVMSPLSSLETIFDCKVCGTLLFAGTSIISTEIILPDVSTIFAKRTATPTSAQHREWLLNTNPQSDTRHNIPMEVETSGLDDQSDCSSFDIATFPSQGTSPITAPCVTNAHRWETVDFEGRRMRGHTCSSVRDSMGSFHFPPPKSGDADSMQSSRHSCTSTSGAMDWERTSTASINSPLKLEQAVMSDQPSVGIPYLKLLVGMTVGSSPTHAHPSTPNNQTCRVIPSSRSFCSDSPDVSDVSSSALFISQSRPQSAEKRRWLAQMAMEGHGAISNSPSQKELDLLHLTTQDGKWILVEPLQWMGDIRGDFCGKICCPNPSCRCVLGEWSWLPGKLGPPCIAPPTIGLLETAIRMTKNTLSQFDRQSGMLNNKDSSGKKTRSNISPATARTANHDSADLQSLNSGTTTSQRRLCEVHHQY